MSGDDRTTPPSFLTGRSQALNLDDSNLEMGVGEGDGAYMNHAPAQNRPLSPLGSLSDSPARRRQGMIRRCSTGSMTLKHRARPIMPFFYNRRSNEDLMYILVVSNPRCNLQNVNRLVEEITHRIDCVDLVLLTGNLSNLSESFFPASAHSPLLVFFCPYLYLYGPVDLFLPLPRPHSLPPSLSRPLPLSHILSLSHSVFS